MFRRGMTKLALAIALAVVLLMSSVPATAGGGPTRPVTRSAAGDGFWMQWLGWFGEKVSGLSSLWAATSERNNPRGPAPTGLNEDPGGTNPDYAAGIDPNGEQ